MKNNKPDISLIRKYLDGELDGRAMYELERQAQEDPALMDMIQGMEMGNKTRDEANLSDIERMISERVQGGKTQRIVAWKTWSVAASLVLMSVIAGLWIFRTPQQQVEQAKVLRKEKREAQPMFRATPQVSTDTLSTNAPVATAKNSRISLKRPSVERLSAAEKPVVKGHPGAAEQVFGVPPVAVPVHESLAALDDQVKDKADQTLNEVLTSRDVIAPKRNDTMNTALAGRVAGMNVSTARLSKARTAAAAKPADAGLSEVTVAYGLQKQALPQEAESLKSGEAQPVIGWDAYKKYLKEAASSPDSLRGIVTVAFTLDLNGSPANVRVTKGLGQKTDEKAVAIVLNGSKWTAGKEGTGKEISIKIRFH